MCDERNREDLQSSEHTQHTEKFCEHAKVLSQEQIAADVYSLWIQTEQIARSAKPGQFLALYTKDSARLLPRPISICERRETALRMVYRTVGAGTKEFSRLGKGDFIDVMGPLGNGYTLFRKKAIVIGGGIGIPPMLELAKKLDASCDTDIVLGYKDELFLHKEFEQYGRVSVATEDGSFGIKGNVLDVIQQKNIAGEVIYACGPMPMLRAVKRYAEDNGIQCYISLEERMACGIGACLGCVCKTKERDEHSKVHNQRICKEGPVFYAQDIDSL